MKKPKRFKKRVEWKEDKLRREMFLTFAIFIGAFYLVGFIGLLFNGFDIPKEQIINLTSMGAFIVLLIIVALIPERKVYWEEVKDD